ncbi:helix-turn-helix domain-containing protein [Alicyclobacillus ferrooxydans]|uniref:Uncharacterized protein n=1 Tax=Alicyclobacillus ferrooxydans TaxID=471514 RepID=A0A0P9CBI6_9BACL|nr:helix-turn-helix domain-containing protein [Alicyclobacillus ferrooxydans]KPV42881.1 hypothetical protein AN477_15210 [Alicyclobacillus ferrooxydans]
MGVELIPMSELAKRAGVPLSTANKYVRRYSDLFHPVATARGSRFPVTDLQILKDIYENSPRRNQKPPIRPKSRKSDKSVQQPKADGRTLPLERLTEKLPVPQPEADAQEVSMPETQPDTPVASVPEGQSETPIVSVSVSETHSDVRTDSDADESVPGGYPQLSVQAIVDAVTSSVAVDVESLLRMERQILTVLGNIDERYRFMFDQFDQLNRIIARSWETQQMFAETINQTLDRFKQQDKIIDMLMEHNKKLEKENSRLLELFSAAKEAAAAIEPAGPSSPAPTERNTPPQLSPAVRPAPAEEQQSRGFLRRRRRKR